MKAITGILARLAGIMLFTLLPAVLSGKYSFETHFTISLVILVIWWFLEPFDPSKDW